jgi:hypothetical protein
MQRERNIAQAAESGQQALEDEQEKQGQEIQVQPHERRNAINFASGLRDNNPKLIPSLGSIPRVAASLTTMLQGQQQPLGGVNQQGQAGQPPPPSGTLALTNKQGGSRKYKLKTRKLRKRRKNKTRNFRRKNKTRNFH